MRTLHGIEFSSTHIGEAGDGASDERIAVAEIRHGQISYGTISANPRLQFAFGAALASAFLVAVGRLAAALADGRRVALKMEVGLLVLSMIGVWVIWDVCRKVHHIKLSTDSGIKRLRLLAHDPASIDELRKTATEISKLALK